MDFVPPSLDPRTGVLSKDVTIVAGAVSARLFLPKPQQENKKKIPILVYYHGGGFTEYTPFCSVFHNYLNLLVSHSHVLAVSVAYRLAPYHLLPAAYDDSWSALQWIASSHSDPWLAEHGDFHRIFIAGDSAGANICHQMALRVGKIGLGLGIEKIEGMVLVHPYFWGSKPLASEVSAQWVRDVMDGNWKAVNAPGVGPDHPWINPLAEGAPSLKGVACRRVLVCVAAKDWLVERGRAYYEALKGEREWEGEVAMVVTEGETHGFHLRDQESEKALELMDEFAGFLNHEKKGDGLFGKFLSWMVGRAEEPSPMQWVLAQFCLGSCVEMLVEREFMGF